MADGDGPCQTGYLSKCELSLSSWPFGGCLGSGGSTGTIPKQKNKSRWNQELFILSKFSENTGARNIFSKQLIYRKYFPITQAGLF